MEVFEAIEQRYSCRDLEPIEVSADDLEKILDAGRRAASGCNIQPFEFMVVKDRQNIEKIAEAQKFISGASVIIVIVADPDKSQYWLEDVSAAAENMLLAITALGYASTWVEGTIMPKENELKKHFNVPENMRFMIALPIGKPAKPGAQAGKKKLDSMTHWEKW